MWYGTARMLQRLFICAVCCCLGSCAWMGDSDDRKRPLKGLAEMARNIQDIGAAATAAVRPIGDMNRGLESLGDMEMNIPRFGNSQDWVVIGGRCGGLRGSKPPELPYYELIHPTGKGFRLLEVPDGCAELGEPPDVE